MGVACRLRAVHASILRAKVVEDIIAAVSDEVEIIETRKRPIVKVHELRVSVYGE